MNLRIPADLLPADGRFGSGPAKIRPGALEYLGMRCDLLGTSHRQPPVRNLVADIQQGLAALYRLPEGYEVVLGNGGSTMFWDVAVSCLVEHRSAHAVFGEFTRKFARAAARAPHLAAPAITEVPAGSATLPAVTEEAEAYDWAHNETSTGAAAPVTRLGGDALMLVDATSAAGAMPVDVSSCDVYYFAPQKNFSSDGGLWLALVSPAAIERAARIKESGRWIPESLDFSLAVSNSRQHQTLNTPALATLLLLEDQINWLLDHGGLDFAERRCRTSTGLLYDWAEAHPLASPFVAPEHRSPVVATIDFAPEVDAAALAATLRANGIIDIEPYRGLARNQIRVGAYASVDPEDVAALCACLDYVVERITA
ncbi:MAG: phosphoserine transaminase [Propionibacteriaceae bacterium]|nr:phosphoserine transaminase [Propionibacteriaceae bacterium]